jgi:hypothetical protein
MKAYAVVTTFIIGCFIASHVVASEPAKTEGMTLPASEPTFEKSEAKTIYATIASIDYDNRVAILTTEDGNTMKVQVAQEIKDIKQFKPGDKIAIDILASMTVHLAKDNGITPRKNVYQNVNISPPGKKAVMVKVQVAEVVVTVDKIDAEKRVATLAFVNGDKQTVFVPRTVKNLDKVKVGDKVIYRFSQSIGVRMVKAAKPSTGASPIK